MADTFALNLKKFADKAGENARQVVRQVSIDLLTRIVLGKPPAGYVGGRARANWAVSIGTSNHAVTDRIDKSGQPTIDRGSATILSATSDAPIYIMNSLPYIRPLEYEGHSKQAPAGMVRVSVTEFQTFVDNAVKALPK